MSEVRKRVGGSDSTMFNFPKGSKDKLRNYLDDLNAELDPEYKVTMRDALLAGLSLIEPELVPEEILNTDLIKHVERKRRQQSTRKVDKVLCETRDADGNITGHLVMMYSGKVVPVFFN